MPNVQFSKKRWSKTEHLNSIYIYYIKSQYIFILIAVFLLENKDLAVFPFVHILMAMLDGIKPFLYFQSVSSGLFLIFLINILRG